MAIVFESLFGKQIPILRMEDVVARDEVADIPRIINDHLQHGGVGRIIVDGRKHLLKVDLRTASAYWNHVLSHVQSGQRIAYVLPPDMPSDRLDIALELAGRYGHEMRPFDDFDAAASWVTDSGGPSDDSDTLFL
jgi:hypothetical protein